MNLRLRKIKFPTPPEIEYTKFYQGNKYIGKASDITWSITREMTPIYTMGSREPVSFGRGKSGLAGTLVLSEIYPSKIHGNKFDIVVRKRSNDILSEIKVTDAEIIDEGGGVPLHRCKVRKEQYTFVAQGTTTWSTVHD